MAVKEVELVLQPDTVSDSIGNAGFLGVQFRTVQGPHRDGGDDAKKTGRNTTGRDR